MQTNLTTKPRHKSHIKDQLPADSSSFTNGNNQVNVDTTLHPMSV